MGLPELNDDQRYQAMRSRDQRFDGVFIVGVRTTGIYCRPSCPTPVQPLQRNVDFFRTTAAAQRSGLRACKRCRPDATPASPEWNLNDDLVSRSMRLIANGYLDRHGVPELAGELHVTERHLRRVMIDGVGAPPLAIARAQRAQTARTLIETTTLAFTDIAFAAGFSSLRQFNDTVRQVFASTPTELRRTRKTTSSATDKALAGTLSIRLPFRGPYASEYFLAWLERRVVTGVSRVHDGEISTALRLSQGLGQASLRFADAWVQATISLEHMADLPLAVQQCRSMLDLDADPITIDDALIGQPAVASLVAERPGLRSPGSVDGFATLAFAILGQQRSVAAARTLADRIVQRARGGEERARGGEELEPTPLAPFPAAAELAELNLEELGMTRRNIATLHDAATRFVDREEQLSPSGSRPAVREELVAIKGIGPWTADYVAMRAMAHPDIWLGGDLVAARHATALGLDVATIATVSPWRSYLTHHLWAGSASPEPTKNKAQKGKSK